MLQKLPKPSTAAQPDIKVEALEEVANELPPLLLRYWREVGQSEIPIDPDWQGLMRQSAMGLLQLVTLRHEKIMVGFAVNLFYFHVSHRTVPHAMVLWVWVDPAYRVGMLANTFMKKNLDFIKDKFEVMKVTGPKIIYIATPNERAAALYERMGFKFTEAVYSMVLT